MKKKIAVCLTTGVIMVFFIVVNAFAQNDTILKIEPVVAFQGSWEEMGKQTAYYFPDIIIKGALIFTLVFSIDAEEARAHYAEIEDLIPEGIVQQMQGIALGLTEYWNISYDTAWNMVLAWNFGIDINYRHKQEETEQGCTAFAVSSSDGTFLCHNTDNQPGTESMGAAIDYQPDTGENAFLSFFSPGFVGVGIAINEQDIGFTYNVGRPNKSPTNGLPAIFLAREVMAKADTLDEAIAYFEDFLDEGNQFSYQGVNFLLVDFKDNSMARLQICSDDIKITFTEELKEGVYYVACTNHFDDDFSPSPEEDLHDSSHQRYERLMEILPQYETYDLKACWEILSDQGEDGISTNNTICRDGESTDTTLGNIFSSEAAYYAMGKTCDYLEQHGEAQAIQLDAIIQPSISGVVTARGQPLAQAKLEL